MRSFRLDLILPAIYQQLGPQWLLFSIVALLIVMFARTTRATMLALGLLMCTQIWYGPLHLVAMNLRWVLLTILCIRGLASSWRGGGARNESRLARSLAVALGALALASCIWGVDSPDYAFFVAGSFCLGLVVTFGLLWRLADGEDVMTQFARGALVLSIVAFGGGFLVAWAADAMGAEEIYFATRLGTTDMGGRYQGLFYNPNAAGLLASMLLPIVVASPRQVFARLEWLRLPACGFMAATIFLSGSRSALIGAALSLLILALYRFGVGAIITVAVGGVLAAMFIVTSPVDDIDTSAVGHIARTKHLSTLSGRVELWEAGWQEAQSSLVLGSGWGHSRVLGGEFDTEQAIQLGMVRAGTNLHNAHLQLLIDVGLIGVCLFWAFSLCVIAAGVRILRAPKHPSNAVGVVVFTSFLAMLADTWVHGGIWSMGNPTTLAFWGLCVLTLKQGERAREMIVGERDRAAVWRAARTTMLPSPA